MSQEIFEVNDYVKIIHPDYPELEGFAKVIKQRTSKVVVIEFCDDGSSFFAHINFIQLATHEEIQKHFTVYPRKTE